MSHWHFTDMAEREKLLDDMHTYLLDNYSQQRAGCLEGVGHGLTLSRPSEVADAIDAHLGSTAVYR